MPIRFYRSPTAARRRAAPGRWTIAALATLLVALPAGAEGLLERVEAARGTAWLLGSLHFARDDLYPLGEPIERAFAASDRLLVEVNLLDLEPAEVADVVRRYGSYPEDDSLRNHLPEPLWQRLSHAARDLGLPLRAVERKRPWLAALTLTSAYLERNGLQARQGVDQHFLRRAKRAGLPILELESFETQLRLLEGLPEDEQILMLEDTLDDVDGGRGLPLELLSAWRTGDRARLEALLVGRFSASEQGRSLARRLLHARNAPMAKRIAEELEKGGTVFVVVGAAHLLGGQGLSSKLQEMGLPVTRH